jgi:hypothetical protein
MAAKTLGTPNVAQRQRAANSPTNQTASGSAEQNRNLRTQALSGNAAASGASGLSTHSDGIDPMALLHGESATKDGNDVVGPTDIPGVLYSNTSETNLNKKSNWANRLGFSLGRAYEATVTLDDLILAGQRIQSPQANDVGAVEVPQGAGKTDVREYDYIHSPTGSVVEQGANRFALRGGAGGVGEPVTLQFANNGGLNLARLARSAYELAFAKGVTIRGGTIDYHGQTFALGCTVQMGNAKEAEAARAYGFVGEFDLKWINEKVSTTVESLCETTVVAVGKAMASPMDGGLLHPNHENVAALQTPSHDVSPDGSAPMQRKKGVKPITSKAFGDPTVRSWGEGAGEKTWITDPGALAAAAQRRLQGAWASGNDWQGHPTYITDCPDFSDVLTECFSACGATERGVADMAPLLLGAIRQIGVMLQLAPMNHGILDDPALLSRLEVSNRKIMAGAFARVSLATVKAALEWLKTAQRTPVTKPSEAPVGGEAPNDEGMVVLNDWSSRD